MNVGDSLSSRMSKLRHQPTNLSDLDGLLVNSEKFNQVFVQKINPVWLKRMLERVASSHTHLFKLVDILINMITSGKHPEWTKRAIKWLVQIMRDPKISSSLLSCRPSLCHLLSFASEMSGVHRLLMSVVDIARKGEKAKPPTKITDSTIMIDTGYVFVDDSDENFGVRSVKRRRVISETEEELIEEEEGSILCDDEDVSLDEEEEEDDEVDASADDGVFDVEDETSVSDNQQQPLQHSLTTARHVVRPLPASESDESESESNASSSSNEQESEDEEGNAAAFSEDENVVKEESEKEDSEMEEEIKTSRKRSLRSSPATTANVRSLRSRKN